MTEGVKAWGGRLETKETISRGLHGNYKQVGGKNQSEPKIQGKTCIKTFVGEGFAHKRRQE